MPDSVTPAPLRSASYSGMSKRAGGIMLSTLLLAGCSAAIERPQASIDAAQTGIPAQWRMDEQPETAELAETKSAELAQWWQGFNDPLLTRLVDEAVRDNSDIAVALGRLRSARAALAGSRGALLPSLSGGASASRNETLNGGGGGSSFYDIGIDASWEIDLFGRLSGTVDASRADLAASEANLFDVHRLITADVALNYFTLRDAQARLSIAERNLSIQRENRQIAEWRYQAGLVSMIDVEQARTLVAQTEATLPPLRETINASIHQIDVLRGLAPGQSATLLSPAAPLPAPPAINAVGIPAELLERRPDLIAARKILEADVIRIGVARADLYPALRLSGDIGTSAVTGAGLFDIVAGGLLGSITAPIFQGGQIRARIEQQRGSADASLASYRRTILNALQEVENALQGVTSARDREAALARAEASAEETLRLAEIRYRSGAIDFQQLLDAQRTLLNAQDSRQAARTAQSTAAVQLFKALGGGWPSTPTSSQEFAQ